MDAACHPRVLRVKSRALSIRVRAWSKMTCLRKSTRPQIAHVPAQKILANELDKDQDNLIGGPQEFAAELPAAC